MKSTIFDIGNGNAIASFADKLKIDFPALNVVIHNAGIMRFESLRDGSVGDAEATVATNLLGPIRLNAALLPLLQIQPRAAIMTVSSGLAFVPMAATPTYCATKAAIIRIRNRCVTSSETPPCKCWNLFRPMSRPN